MKNKSRFKAEKLNNLAYDLEEEGKMKDAIAAYKRAIDADKNWAVPYYNLGLLYKYRHQWAISLRYNQKAYALDPSDQAAWWNAGIAATALSNWQAARKAWTGFGILLPSTSSLQEEVRLQIGMTPLRLVENKEVVWGERIDPARAVIINIPTKKSKRRFKDIVLNDGAPNGTRIQEGQAFPVFDELTLWQASTFQTYTFWIEKAHFRYLEILDELCEKRDFGCENWTDTIRQICQKCSEGLPHEHHDKSLKRKVIEGEFNLAVAVPSEDELNQLLIEWGRLTSIQVTDLERII